MPQPENPSSPTPLERPGVFFAFAACGFALAVCTTASAKPQAASHHRKNTMACTCVVGLLWGDEAKGKIVDLLTHCHDYVVRYNERANAGHTVVSAGKTFKFSLLLTGILHPHLHSSIANGVVVNPVKFLQEVNDIRGGGIPVGDNLS